MNCNEKSDACSNLDPPLKTTEINCTEYDEDSVSLPVDLHIRRSMNNMENIFFMIFESNCQGMSNL